MVARPVAAVAGEILVGRHSLRFIDTSSAPAGVGADTPSGTETVTG